MCLWGRLLPKKSMLESLSAAGSKPSRRNKQTSETAAAPRKQKTWPTNICFLPDRWCMDYKPPFYLIKRGSAQNIKVFQMSWWHLNLWQRTAQVIGLGIPAEMNAKSHPNKKSFCSPQNAETMNVEVKPCCSFVRRPFFSFCQTKWVIIDQLLFQIMKLIWQRYTT